MHFFKLHTLLLILAFAAGLSSCRPKPGHSTASTKAGDSALAAENPLLPHLENQKKQLQAHSKKAKQELSPDGKYLNEVFAGGCIVLELDKVDGEPAHFYGKAPNREWEGEMEFLVYKISMDDLDALENGKRYEVSWIETIALMEPFDEGYQHCFVAYRIEPLY